MGKAGGTVRGKTKKETYSAYASERDSARAMNLVVDFPKNREEAYEQMEKDPKTGDWVLEYHFSA